MNRFDDCGDVVRKSILHLNDCEQWMLNASQIDEYIAVITRLYPELPDNLELLSKWISNYHFEHRLIQALADQSHPDHGRAWNDLIRQIANQLAPKEVYAYGDRQTIMSDLIQETCLLIFKSINQFKYKSRLRTWVYTIVNNQYLQYVRKLKTRNQLKPDQSIDDEIGLELADRNESLESVVDFNLLHQHCIAILRQAPDPRLADIFQYYAVEELTLKQIAAKEGLSIGRVHELFKKIQTILYTDPIIIYWRNDAATSDDSAEPK
ncbi:RNA polymerase, sigma-24 subunit, ECF subfamily [Herpetosiphon aurantiacus DSM 785]|uniref:RNA polymerase, sigma-24 subunit, ECF subfamily n=2 Tax=Herpetosiphon TaxID=64 RepID=A9AYN7_HERA2|nr:RNA polymerase, sigma-24 subunit, ECF subfamily [Herpetosiphon aurantiacus DSM 785]